MQTFLPFFDFRHVAHILDSRRLGKQRVEAKQILDILTGKTQSKHWKNHPAVLMWQGHEVLLAEYGEQMCAEWQRRGYSDTLLKYFRAYMRNPTTNNGYPWWFTDKRLSRSHQSNLLRKNRSYYRNFFPKVRDDLPYWWPTQNVPKTLPIPSPPMITSSTVSSNVKMKAKWTVTSHSPSAPKAFVPEMRDGKLSWEPAPAPTVTGWTGIPNQIVASMATEIAKEIDKEILKGFPAPSS